MNLSTLGLIVWLLSPTSNQWENADNWEPSGPPSRRDSALFLYSAQHDIDLTGAPSVGGLEFREAFRFRVKPMAFFTLEGKVTMSKRIPEFVIEGASSSSGGQMEVAEAASLGQGRVILKGVRDGNGGKLEILGRAGNPRLYVNRGSYLVFDDFGDADHAFILAKPEGDGMFGGQIYFLGHSTAENAIIVLSGHYSALQVQDHIGLITVGKLSGDGAVFVGSNTLVVRDCTGFTGAVDAQGLGGRLQCENSPK